MNFDLDHQSEREAKLHLLIDALANVYTIKEIVLDIYCKENNIDYKEASDKFEKMTVIHRQQIHDTTDTEFGHIKTEDLTK